MIEVIFEYLYKRVMSAKNSVSILNQFSDVLWVVVSDKEENTKMVFQDNGRLVVSQNGEVIIGSYEPIVSANSIIINIGNTSRIYNHVFTDEGLIFLKLDAINAEPMVLVNNSLLGDKSGIDYLYDKFESPALLSKAVDDRGLTPYISLKSNRFRKIDILRSKIDGRLYASSDGRFLDNGHYRVPMTNEVVIYVGEAGLVSTIFQKHSFKIKDLGELCIHTKVNEYPGVGCSVYLNEVIAPDGVYKLGWFNKVTVDKGKVTKY